MRANVRASLDRMQQLSFDVSLLDQSGYSVTFNFADDVGNPREWLLMEVSTTLDADEDDEDEEGD